MDPVSRRLAAAAMGLAFGLSRDEELERTRLDLERARMEREDFRQGGGPDTAFMHRARDHSSAPFMRKESERAYQPLHGAITRAISGNSSDGAQEEQTGARGFAG